jgi:hypothetical protein
MFALKNNIDTYAEIDSSVIGAEFEQKWFESVIMILNRIKNNHYTTSESIRRLGEICSSLQWVQANLNERLNSQHRTMLKSIYSTNIQIINSAIETKNMNYLDIVISTLKTVTEPYYRNTV